MVFEIIYLTTPISNVVHQVLGELSDGYPNNLLYNIQVASDLCDTIRLAMQSSDSREPQITRAIIFDYNKVYFLCNDGL